MARTAVRTLHFHFHFFCSFSVFESPVAKNNKVLLRKHGGVYTRVALEQASTLEVSTLASATERERESRDRDRDRASKHTSIRFLERE